MTWDDLARQAEAFADIAAEFVEFAQGAEWIIHNAPFDVAFHRCRARARGPAVDCVDLYETLIDTLALARETFPGKRNNLDALCERFGVIQRAIARCMARCSTRGCWPDVYLAMTRGPGIADDRHRGRRAGAGGRWCCRSAHGDRAGRCAVVDAVGRRSCRRTATTWTRSIATRRVAASGSRLSARQAA